MGSDVLALVAAVLLLAGNAFFVGAEFALVSARRDRLESMADSGQAAAGVVLRAHADLSRMLAASQLGITICSLLLGRLGEPAVAHLIEAPLALVGLPEAVLHPIAFAVSLAVVVVAHMVLGEMVPKNIAIAGPEAAAIVLVPPFLVFTTAARPLIAFFNFLANGVLRLVGVEPRDELEAAFTSGELADLITESRREGLLDDEETSRLARTLRSAQATVADVVIATGDLVTLGPRPVVGDVAREVARTGYSRFPLRATDGRLTGYLHVKDILDLADDEDAAVPPARIRALPEVPVGARLDDALAVLRRHRAHLGRAVGPGGSTVGLVTMEDLIERYVGDVRDATHAPDGQVRPT
ncbi:HlyC/CorC family transporter [Pseudonocardia sp. KRD-184]|uniref:HlyC/CorC family transporter n=1 Tax=Pseudonocardia oceani TaxID=2792013 RepID=A0ABS6UJ83_9PSEU|nr:hemolysin family protein [Pseudonocardia oceani]MBW0090875.1 HlyC/CorC family transporter [Pseudonocardia oceani]MBW0096663.1 HlyC/CorC family transporter [Pseudonocardia oceani]MBW0110543.1 HlyC/CorC family transporter [Pseudonocardia oceani]MBW0122117.1 HlyC/CorC family transporter [Pseudonocardia oceani]MBW0131981.1 HlyC/CorC family transporter [Pseudonocardia oceani]